MTEYKDMSFIDAVKYIPARFVNIFNKLLGMKGVIIAVTMYSFKQDLIPAEARGYVWLFIVLIVFFGEKALDVIKDIKR